MYEPNLHKRFVWHQQILIALFSWLPTFCISPTVILTSQPMKQIETDHYSLSPGLFFWMKESFSFLSSSSDSVLCRRIFLDLGSYLHFYCCCCVYLATLISFGENGRWRDKVFAYFFSPIPSFFWICSCWNRRSE